MKTMLTLCSVIVRISVCGVMAQAEVPVEIRELLGEIFADVFSLKDLKEDDTVHPFYSSMCFRGQQIGTGDILATEIVKDGKTYQTYYYSQGKGDEGSGSYCDQNDKSLRQKEGFNIQPVVYMCISSSYGYRVHPVLHTVHMYTGIDYATPEGTSVKAAVDGMVVSKGWKGGYDGTVTV